MRTALVYDAILDRITITFANKRCDCVAVARNLHVTDTNSTEQPSWHASTINDLQQVVFQSPNSVKDALEVEIVTCYGHENSGTYANSCAES